MKYKVLVKSKKSGMNCLIYKAATLNYLMTILQSLSNLDTDKYYIEIKNEEEK